MFGLKTLLRKQREWAEVHDTGMRVVLGDKRAGELIAQGWTIDHTSVALVGGTSSGVLLYHMKREVAPKAPVE